MRGSICSEGLIISKIESLGNGANVFLITATTGTGEGLIFAKHQSLQAFGVGIFESAPSLFAVAANHWG
jgi:hypothetical protein